MIIKDYDLPLLRRALGKELMLTRWQKGISQKQIAARLKLNPKIIDRAELGKYTYYGLIRALLLFYNKEIRIELVDRENSNTL